MKIKCFFGRLLAGSLLALPLACVDEAYDFGNLNTDNITIGENVSGGLGTKSFLMTDFFKDSSNLKTDAEGNYYIFFEEKKILKASAPPKVEDKQYASIGKDVSGWNDAAVGQQDLQYEVEDKAVVELVLSDNIHQLDSILLRKGTLQVEFTVKNLNCEKDNNKTYIDLSVELPKGYFLEDGSQKKDSTFIVRQLKNGKGSLSMKLRRIIPGKDDTFFFSYLLRVPKDTPKGGVTSPSTPRFEASATLKGVEYEIIYGKFATTMDIDETSIHMEDFDDLFEDKDASLSFANPHIELTDTQKLGIPILVDINIVADQESAAITGIKIEPPLVYSPDAKKLNKIWIGATKPEDKEGFVFKESKEVAKILGTVPESLTLHGKAISDSTTAGFYVSPQPDQEFIFAVKVPLEPAESFKITSSEILDGIFDEDLLELLFSNGEVELSGEIRNDLPLDITLKLDIIDAKGGSIGIKWDEKKVEARSSGNVAFLISETDMAKMTNEKTKADGIKIAFTATGSKSAKAKDICLNKDQKIELTLKFKKKGGIVLGEL
ncbi:MAG: DUF4621 domain-containing protein [Tannerellaceae bacterium]|jgi:hypothetical protein|nr:DUF4621 domain-containing protein [Tannerellaceae bacterium]